MTAQAGQPVRLFKKVAVIGAGLIGSSLLRVVKERGVATSASAYDASDAVRNRLRELAICDTVSDTAREAVEGADLVVLAVPVGACGTVAAIIGKHLRAGAIVTDVGSVKGSVAADVAPYIPENAAFVPGHPIAGAERSGPDAGRGDLFANRWWILTPLDTSPLDAVDKLGRFVEAIGAELEIMDTEHHDMVLAITSHIPHLIAYNIVGTAADLESVTKSEVIKFSAGGFRDFTRIAASDPTMWRDVFLNNREAVLEMLTRFSEDLTGLRKAIRLGDGEMLHKLFSRTRKIRREIIESGQEVAAPDFGRDQGAASGDAKAEG